MISMGRYRLLIVLLCLFLITVCARLYHLAVGDRAFLLRQSQSRILRTVSIPAHRGMILDRTGEVLAVSTPADSIWMAPTMMALDNPAYQKLASLLSLPAASIEQGIAKKKNRHFVYLKRRVSLELSQQVMALKIPGVFVQHEYKRYYPDGPVTAHVLGLTNVDDQGQEGLELAYNQWLSGQVGKKQILKDRMGHVIDDIAVLKAPEQGRDLVLSLDKRIQYLAYQALEKAVDQYHAESGSVVVLDVKTGEVLAMVNLPTYDPNGALSRNHGVYRNRAVTDMFEPGSTMKPFNIAFALQSGQYTPDSEINTHPGWMRVGGYTIKDHGRDYGVLTLTEILKKSSNIGAAKILMSLAPQGYWQLLSAIGFGQPTQSGFPGESPGRLVVHDRWRPSVVATLSYGYGIAVTALQMAKAYAVLGNWGLAIPVSFMKLSSAPAGKRVIRPDVAKQVVAMLEYVVKQGGTGRHAHLYAYRVAGKTGTAYIANQSGYDKKRYIASFVGLAPVSQPRIVVSVMLRDPKGQHYGGVVAAPVFAQVAEGALHLLGVRPDQGQSVALPAE